MLPGTPGDGKRVVWVIARQHPGESMAEWFMQVPRKQHTRSLYHFGVFCDACQPAPVPDTIVCAVYCHEVELTKVAAQGFLDKLLDRHDGLSKEVLRKAVFYIVPCANPDGELYSWSPERKCIAERTRR